MKLMKVCLVLLVTISMVSIHSANALIDDFEYELLSDGTIEIQAYSGEDINLTIPSQIDGVSVTSLGEDSFSCCDTLESVTIPKSIKNIGSLAFSDCTSLKSISIPNSVTAIGDYAFCGCTSLTNVKLPTKIQKLLEYTFSECSNLKEITIPSSVTTIEEGVFDCCSSLTNITIPNSVTSLGDYSFNECTNLKEITIPSSVTNIGESAFSECESLTHITIQSEITKISDFTFSDCTSLENMIIPDTVTSIGDSAFDGCIRLKSLVIPKTVTDIGEDAFYDCNKLTLKVYPKSYALWYAKENHIPYEIIKILASSVKLDKASLSLHIGDSVTLKATINPSDTTNKKITWTSSHPDIVKVDSKGKVTALSYGEATITVKTSNGKEAICQVKVIDPNIHITSIALNQTNITLSKGNTYTLIGTIYPQNTTDSKILSWSSNHPDVVSVDDKGHITALSKGEAIITVKTSNGKEAQCLVTVEEPIINIPITAISLNQTTLTLDKGEEYTLIGTIVPDNTTDSQILSWDSTDTSVVTVDNGHILAVSQGQATITVETSNGLTATCEVTVLPMKTSETKDKENHNFEVLVERERKTILKEVKTKDQTNMILWIEMVIGSFMILVCLFYQLKKE